MGKPRMTRSDKWKRRDCVMRYRAFKDELKLRTNGKIPDDPDRVSWVAYLPIPKSWPKKKKDSHRNTLHRQKPDRDNIDKAILDALWEDDSGIASGSLEKRWDDGNGPRIVMWFD